MNRLRPPSCSQCKCIYQIKDIHGCMIPILLNCGHNMCKKCLKYMYKTNKQIIICSVCRDTTRVECEDQLFKFPIHYYLVGKLWCLYFYKKQELNDDISKLNIASVSSNFSDIKENSCFKCHQFTNNCCDQCFQMCCEECFNEIHSNSIYCQHKLIALNNVDSNVSQELNCKEHFKSLDSICHTCQLQVCSICAYKYHYLSEHKVYLLQQYILEQVEHLEKCIIKGNTVLQNLKFSKNRLNTDLIKYQDKMKKKTGNLDAGKQKITTFIGSIIGVLQGTEQMLVNVLNEAEQATIDSMNNVMSNLNNAIADLQDRVNGAEQLLMRSDQQITPAAVCNAIADVELTLSCAGALTVAKKNSFEPTIHCDHRVFNGTRRCVTIDMVNTIDAYMLINSSDVPPGYTELASVPVPPTIDYNVPSFNRPSSSLSSLNTLSRSSSSNFSSNSMNPFAISTPSPTPSPTPPMQKRSLSTPKDIVNNETEIIIVTHVNSPSDFYLQLMKNESVMRMITIALHNFVETQFRTLHNIKMDNVIYAVLSANHKWVRGVVVNKNIECNETKYTVHCIDFGFTETLTIDKIKRAPASVVSIPALAHNCALYSLKPSSISGWTNEAVTVFNKLISEKHGTYFVYPVDTFGEPLEVDIVWINDIHPLSIHDAMYFLGHGSSDEHGNSDLQNKLMKIITLPKPVKLKKKEKYSIILTHFISPSEFYLRMNDEDTVDLLNNMMTALESLYKPTEEDSHKGYLLYSPRIGMAVAARYSIDNNWYRAKIINLPEPRMVTVFYIDYGNSETLPWNQLRVLEKSFIQKAPLAIKASLAEIGPAEKGEDTTAWSENACAALIKLTDSFGTVDNLTVHVHEIEDDDTHKVILYNRWSREEFCVNSRLITQGHAVSLNFDSSVLRKLNQRKPTKVKAMKLNTRNKDDVCSLSNDFSTFIEQRQLNESPSHSWKQTSKKNPDIPGVEMIIHKFISPDEIILKYTDHNIVKLTELMNKFYKSNTKMLKECNWNVNSLCALFIKAFGNWYRGKILEVNTTTKKASVYLYDLDKIYDDVSFNSLRSLNVTCAQEKCGLLHCCMFNLFPLGSSDGLWPKFSCERLIEELKRYPSVYFTKKDKVNNKAAGEIWVKNIEKPKALEPIRVFWTNMNQFMIEQGLAISNKQHTKDHGPSISSSEEEFNQLPVTDQHNTLHVSRWLPPIPLKPDKSRYNAIVLYVDMQCNVYFQIDDDDNKQLLHDTMEYLNEEFCDSSPEPINYQWTVGQMVIVQYHLDKKWYRGTIIKIEKNQTFEVQFLDFGNVENCTHGELRSTVSMTDVPQLCFKGYFCNICPLTKDKKWTVPVLDFLHAMIVDHHCTMLIDFTKSTDNNYAINHMRNETILDVCQYMVTNGYAYYSFMDLLNLNLIDSMDEMDIHVPLKDDFQSCDDNNTNIDESYCNSSTPVASSKGGSNEESKNNIRGSEVDDYSEEEIDCNQIGAAFTELNHFHNDKSRVHSAAFVETNGDGHRRQINQQSILNRENAGFNGHRSMSSVWTAMRSKTDNCIEGKNVNRYVQRSTLTTESDDSSVKSNTWSATYVKVKRLSDSSKNSNDGKTLSTVTVNYSRISFKFNDVIEGTLCKVVTSTRMTLLVEKINNVDLSISKDNMQHTIMSIQCDKLPAINEIVPNTLVVVLHNHLWKRGIITNNSNSVYLVDFGKSIKLIEKNLRLCPKTLLKSPMFSIDCQLAHVSKSETYNEQNVVKKMFKVLKGVNLKIVRIDKSNADIAHVELYNDKNEIAYKSLIDSGILVPK